MRPYAPIVWRSLFRYKKATNNLYNEDKPYLYNAKSVMCVLMCLQKVTRLHLVIS